MSLRSMLQVELDRDVEPPKKRVQKKTQDKKATNAEQVPQGQQDLLVNAVPTEVLAPYTALVGAIVATIDPGESSLTVLRWSIYGAGLVAIALFLGVGYVRGKGTDVKRKFPWAGTITAMAAFAAWGLVMPGSPLSISLSGDSLTRATLLIAAGGAFLVGLFSQPLKTAVK